MRTAYFLNEKIPQVLAGNILCPEIPELLKAVWGMTTPTILGIINAAVSCMEGDEIYLEIGCFQGASVIGALVGNDKRAVAVDNFCEFTETNSNEKLIENLRAYGMEERVAFYPQDFRQFFKHNKVPMKVGVYYYDGAHDYASEYEGLLAGLPYLVDGGLILVDDINWGDPTHALRDFINSYRNEVIDVFTVRNTIGPGHPQSWNGFSVLAWHMNEAFEHAKG